MYIQSYAFFLRGAWETELKVLPYSLLKIMCMSPKSIRTLRGTLCLEAQLQNFGYIYIQFYAFFLRGAWETEQKHVCFIIVTAQLNPTQLNWSVTHPPRIF